MQISHNKVVSVHYKLMVDGEVVDQSSDTPLTYLHGHNAMIKGFERQLEGKKEGDAYDFIVTSEEGYGERDDNAVTDLDLEIFKVDGKISDQVFPGAQLQLRNQEGHPVIGFVKEIGETSVKMDFNHMLAGKTLNFSGTVKEIREATTEELAHGHVHGVGGHQH
jgi:FKBP-type peptidyl-prolyl cis-trans isomerase SlyD